MICVDSDCLINFLKGKEAEIKIMSEYSDDIVTTEINRYEVFEGVYAKLHQKQNEFEETKNFFNSIIVLSGSGWGLTAAKLFCELIKNGKEIDQNDCMIVAIMKANGCNKIITKNKKHFEQIEGIEVIPY